MRTITVLAVSLVLPCSGAFAQQQLPVGHGRQIRITAPDCGLHGQIGRLDGMSGDTLVLVFSTSTMRCARSSVMSLDLRAEPQSKRKQGALTGLLVGGLGGVALGAATYKKCVPEGWFDCYMAPKSSTQQAALVGLVGGALGAVLGAVLGELAGALGKNDRWEEIPLDRLRVSFAPLRDGRFNLGFTLAF